MSIPEPCLCGAWDCPRCYPGENYSPHDEDEEPIDDFVDYDPDEDDYYDRKGFYERT
jgi:hypothetical protein